MNTDQKEAVRARARSAILDLYHNATVNHPYTEDESYWDWFQDAASFEIEYIQEGGAYGSLVRHLHNVGKECDREGRSLAYKSMARRREKRNILIERSRWSAWNYTADWYGKLYQYGRGGRTLAPEDLIRTGGGSTYSVREDYPDDLNMEDCVELIQVIESFNWFVGCWCKDVPDLWADEVQQQEVMLAECGGQ